MTDLIPISLPLNATILSLTSILLSANISPDEIVAITNGNATIADASMGSAMPTWAGFFGCLVASIFFGSFLIPVKQFSAGDGVFFQFVFCVAVFIVGIIVDLITDNQRFYPLAIIGGMRN
jgi:hypothetical protein